MRVDPRIPYIKKHNGKRFWLVGVCNRSDGGVDVLLNPPRYKHLCRIDYEYFIKNYQKVEIDESWR